MDTDKDNSKCQKRYLCPAQSASQLSSEFICKQLLNPSCTSNLITLQNLAEYRVVVWLYFDPRERCRKQKYDRMWGEVMIFTTWVCVWSD